MTTKISSLFSLIYKGVSCKTFIKQLQAFKDVNIIIRSLAYAQQLLLCLIKTSFSTIYGFVLYAIYDSIKQAFIPFLFIWFNLYAYHFCKQLWQIMREKHATILCIEFWTTSSMKKESWQFVKWIKQKVILMPRALYGMSHNCWFCWSFFKKMIQNGLMSNSN